MTRIKLTYRRILSVILVLVSLLGLVRIPALALSADDRSAVDKGSVWHKIEAPSTNCSPEVFTADSSINLIGNDNAEKIFRFFVANGLSKEQAAGVVGNAYVESKFNPKSVSKSGGFSGLFQWDTKGRFANLKKWTQSKGLDPLSLEGQLQFALYEATERGNMAGIKKQAGATPQATEALAAWYWGRFFEVAIINGSTSTTPLTNVQGLAQRISNGLIMLVKYGGSSPSTSTTTAPSTAPASPCTVGNGQATAYIDGFTVYSQYDPAWAKLPYSTSTISDSGCGPSAMAMIITTLTGQVVTPPQTAKYAADQGLYKPGAGSSWEISPILATRWNLKSQPISNDLAKITKALQAGSLIITAGRGPKPFTTNGHFIVIRGITASGKFKIGDSGHSDTSSQEWDPQVILQSMSEGSAYAISK